MHTNTRRRTAVGATLGAVVLAATLGACATGSAPSTPTAPSTAATSSDPGTVVGYTSSRSNCYASLNPDDTANVRLYNSIQTAGVRNFAQATSATDTTILMENFEKNWENGAAAEGKYKCAAVPYLVENNTQNYYWWEGRRWTDHPGWWGHTKNVSWEGSPRGWVRFKCNGKVDKDGNVQPRTGCPESSFGDGYVEVPWNTESSGRNLEAKPSCTVTNPVFGCWTNSYFGGPPEGDFVFDTTVWTAPMRIGLTTDFIADSAGNFVVWEVADATAPGAVWVDGKSPRSQVIRRGSSLYVGGYAVATNGKHSINLTLKPKGLTDPNGDPIVCRNVGQVQNCRSFERPTSIQSIDVQRGVATVTTTESHEFLAGDVVKIEGAANTGNDGDFTITKATDTTFTIANVKAVTQAVEQGAVAFAKEPVPNLGVDVVVTVAATVTLDKISNGGDGKPAATLAIECSANVKTVRAQTLEVACAKAGDPFTYGGAWSVVIKN